MEIIIKLISYVKKEWGRYTLVDSSVQSAGGGGGGGGGGGDSPTSWATGLVLKQTLAFTYIYLYT